MTPSEIKKRIEDAGYTQRQIAEIIGCRPPSISMVIRRKMISDRIMQGIADVIGENHRKAFSWYYLTTPKRKTSKAVGTLG